MTAVLTPVAGALRVRVEEPVWQRIWASGDMSGALEPLSAVEDDSEVSAETGAAARLACANTPIRIELATAAGTRGLLASFGCTGDAAAGAIRALAANPGEDLQRTGGVEISAFRPAQAVDEIVRVFPPGPDEVDAGRSEPVIVPVESAATLPRVIADEGLLREWLRQCGLSEVPPVLRALVERPPTARADLTMRIADGPVAIRTWLRTGFGWVSVGLDGDRVVHRLQGRTDIRADLVAMLAGAYDHVLGEADRG